MTVEDGTSSGYKITISKGSATPGVKDDFQGTVFVVPPDDQAAANTVAGKIDGLPRAAILNLDNFIDSLAAIEEAEAEYQALTEPQKALVDSYLVNKLSDTAAKTEALVLEGIERSELIERKATLFVVDPTKKVHEFLQSGVVSLFQSMFQDVVEMRLGDDPTWYGVEGTASGAIEAGAQITSVLLDLPYAYGTEFGGVFTELAAAKMGELVDKSLGIEVKIERLEGGKRYSGTYLLVFGNAEPLEPVG